MGNGKKIRAVLGKTDSKPDVNVHTPDVLKL